jgi:hypothetical protein
VYERISNPAIGLLCLRDIERQVEKVLAVAAAGHHWVLRHGDGSDRTAADLFAAIEDLMQDTVAVSDLRECLERLVAPPPAE